MPENTKKISDLVRSDVGRKVRYEPDEDTKDTGVIDSIGHHASQTFLSIDHTTHRVADMDATVEFLD